MEQWTTIAEEETPMIDQGLAIWRRRRFEQVYL
jgi:hypothetical protein